MDNNKIVTEKQEKKKRNKLVGWFLDLPKWGKGLLIGGTVAVIATAITVPVVLTMNKGGSNGQVSEADFNKIISYFRDVEDKDERNFTAELYDTWGGTETQKMPISGYIKIDKNLHNGYYKLDEEGDEEIHNQKLVRDGKFVLMCDIDKDNDRYIKGGSLSVDYTHFFSQALKEGNINYKNCTFSNGAYNFEGDVPMKEGQSTHLKISFYIGNVDGEKRLERVESFMGESGEGYNIKLKFKDYNKTSVDFSSFNDLATVIEKDADESTGKFSTIDINNKNTLIVLNSKNTTETNKGKWTFQTGKGKEKDDNIELFDYNDPSEAIDSLTEDKKTLGYKSTMSSKSIIVANYQSSTITDKLEFSNS